MPKNVYQRLKRAFKTQLSVYRWRSLLSMVLGLMVQEGRKTLTELALLVSVSALSRTFTADDWSQPASRSLRRHHIEMAIVTHHLNRRGRRPTIYLFIDATVLPKRGQELPQLGWHYDSCTDSVTWGQKLVIAAVGVGVGEIVAPWDWRNYVNKRFVKEEDFRKQTELTAGLIRAFQPPYGGKVVVVVDCSLLAEPVIEAAMGCGYGLVSYVRENRRLADGRYARAAATGEGACLNGMEIPLQIVHMVRGGRHYTVVTTLTELGAMPIRHHMRRRDWIEKLIKELKQRFGLEDCQCRGEGSLERWVELVWLAYVLAVEQCWAEKHNGRWNGADEAGAGVTSWWTSQRGIGHAVMWGMKRDGLGLRVRRRLSHYLKAEASWLEPLLDGQMKQGQGGLMPV
ncbi:MAG: transposase [Candidatus Bipolaricaulia bacterium]